MKTRVQRSARKRASSRQNLDAQLAQLETAQLVRHLIEEDPAYIFKHALTQATTYEALLKNQRRALHARVAQAYQEVYADRCADEFAAVLAFHFGEAGDDANALIYATHAGDVAARVYANTEAIVFYSQALDAAKRINATTAQLIHLYAKRGRVLEVIGNIEALATYEEMTQFARTRGDHALELQSLLLRGTIHATPSPAFDRTQAIALAEQAMTLARELGDRQAQAYALWNRMLVCLYNSEIPDAIRYGEQALTIAREFEARDLLGYILGDLSRAYLQASQAFRAPALGDEARAIWRALDNKPMLADNLMQSATLALLRGDYDETIALTEEGIAISRMIDSKLGLMSNLGTQVFPCLDRGEFARAFKLVEEILREIEELPGSFTYPMQYAFGAWVDGLVGAFARGAEKAERARRALSSTTPEFFRAWAWVMLARFYLAAGNLNDALSALADSQMDFNSERFGPAHLFGALAHGECLIAQGEFARAAQLMDERAQPLRQFGFRQTLHDVLFIQAQATRGLGETEQAIELLRQAREVAEGMSARRLLWQIYATLSEIENERGNPIEAKNFRAQAREVIDYIAAHTPEEFRASFLNLPDVRATMETL